MLIQLFFSMSLLANIYLRANTSRSLAETGDDSHGDRPPVSVPPGVLYGLVVNALSSITVKHCFKLAGDNIFSVSLRGLAMHPFWQLPIILLS